MKFISKLILLCLFCFPTSAFADFSAAVQEDFAVVDGVVVMPIDDEFIIDLDARSNLQVGDILTLVNPGTKILHPVTKEVIGSVVEPAGFLQVTRILSGYSYAKALTPGLAPQAGAPVKRFEQVPARFVLETDGDEQAMRRFKTNLPQLEWLEEAERERALLTFTQQGNSIEVRNAAGDALHSYRLTEDQQVVSTTAAPAYSYGMTQPKPKLLQQVANTLLSPFGGSNQRRFAEMDAAIIRQKMVDRQDIWIGPNLAGHPIGMTVADFDGDGLQEIAVAKNDPDNSLVIARITAGDYDQLAEIALPPLNIISLDAADLDGDGRAELYLSALNDQKMSSLMVAFDEGRYRIEIENIPWFLRSVDLLDPQGPVLLGQMLGDQEQVFAGKVFKVRREGDQLVEGDRIDLPNPLNIFSFVPFADNQGALHFAHLSTNDYLKVYSKDGVEFWESADYFGGSENSFTLRAGTTDELYQPTWMKPRLLRMADNSILVVQNEGLRMVQRYRKFQNSRIVAFQWNGYALVENWRTADQDGYLGDFTLADADNDGKFELVMVVKFKHRGLIDAARSAIVTYELE
jgi:hypothetical protein